ncbi:SLBB domain-containing protein [Phenylobacterium sp.]|uniref:SLBB domain-containing protein n=1 Tax=Phenylobacterium sp. TaxID=1871053 RepID=UPI002F3E6EBF
MLRSALLSLVAAILMIGVAQTQAIGQPAPPPAGGQGQEAAPAGSAPAAPVDSSYVIGVGDVVEIGLVGRQDFTNRVRVATDGTVLLPLIGHIKAVDRNVIELSDDVRQALIKGGFYSDPVVRADVVGISSRYVTVLGNVAAPGLLPLDRNYRLSEIIAKVGGRGGTGGTYVLLTRAGADKAVRYSIDKLAQGSGDDDPIVKAGDKIYVPTSETEVFYISGEVKSPGAFPVSDKMSIRQAIARGGGVTENGSENKVTLIRDGKEVKKVSLDDPVKVGDIIKIGERLF